MKVVYKSLSILLLTAGTTIPSAMGQVKISNAAAAMTQSDVAYICKDGKKLQF